METENFKRGLDLRRELSGDKVVDDAFANTDDIAFPLQELVTEFCFGAVWGRRGLDRRSRSILNIGMLAALNRPEELAGHIRTGLKNGLSRTEIQECLLQVAVYAGMPAGFGGMRVARQVFSEVK
ncbi:carboxymuconolactone decarboxylase family protein [Paraburkholderia sp. HD33-4]|uniref:carboxymuconolactone decarboxylase family protein n=1 Tax=Paraburkholderia sp. HD33-4 TaxID=2883242 RepID=UPI001F3AC586|nr:carboxymuconolactone decarboxylase family protein [Paraburkholderia sp. HD33-4]